jgi:hypothetical protein
MKNIVISSLALLLMSSCAVYYSHVIESDYSYEGNFNKYKTFDFAVGGKFEGNSLQQQVIEKFLQQRMESWGYRYNTEKPNLVVFYNLYYDSFDFQSYKQPDFESWVTWNFPTADEQIKLKKEMSRDEYLKHKRRAKYDSEVYQKVPYRMQEGTVLISFYDPKKNETIWQGYATGLLPDEELANERILQHTVTQILDEYRVLAFAPNL